jgi:DNA polymerase-3 subunit delta'
MSPAIPALPWHARQWQSLHAMMDAQRLHHALLLCGPAGVGKRVFAERAAVALLCEQRAEAALRPCGECRSCQLSAAGSHPDRIDIQPEEDKRIIGVDQVRSRLGDLVLTPHYAARRVALVSPAEALNRHAADTLLKTLEEPTASVVFLLVSSRPSSLPVTVRSRCLRIPFEAADTAGAMAWLREQDLDLSGVPELLDWCSGAPLAAAEASRCGLADGVQALATDLELLLGGRLAVVAAAERWRKAGLAQVLDWQLRILIGLMRRASGVEDVAGRLATHRITCKLDLRGLNRLCEELLELRSASERQLNPNEQLALEHLAASWVGLRPRRG